MTVYRRTKEPGQPWYYDFQLSKVRYQGYCLDSESGAPARSEKEARDIEGAERRAAKACQGIARSGIRAGAFTLAQAMTLHLDNQVESTPEHVANLAMYSREILAFFKPETPVTKIPVQRVQAYRKHCAEQLVRIWIGGGGKHNKKKDRHDPKFWKAGDRMRSAATVNHYLDCLRGAFTQAHEAKHPVTGQPMLPFPPKVEPLDAPKRKPTPMQDSELEARLAVAMPWVRESAEFARYYGLRMDEAARVTIRHVDFEARCLRFKGEDQKSGRDEEAYGGAIGWRLVQRLVKQARTRGQDHLITWPGPQHTWNVRMGRGVPRDAWRPLKSVRKSWATSAKDAGIEKPRRFHDVRGAYITQVARGTRSSRMIREAARHRDQSTTDRYIEIAQNETAKAVEKAMRPAGPKLRLVSGGRR